MASSKGPGLYEFLIEAELQQYYAGFKNDLKVQNVPQLKYVTEEDLLSIGMSKPEMRRLKKFFQRHYPQNYLSRFKKIILSKREKSHESSLAITNEVPEKPTIKVPNKHIIPAEAIVVNKELGQGEFGTVQQGVWTDEDDRIQVAIKCLSRERMQNNPIEFLKEAAIMHGIDHEHIVRLYGVVLDTNSLMLVTELAPLRSLLECLKEPSLRANFPVLSLCDFAIQVCDGMQYLEQKRLIHRDLAARNILVFSKNKVKISDFGLSRALGVGKDYYQTNFNVNLKLPIAWCAPECISYLRFTSASDVWAYGVTLWEMFSYGFQPWAALTGQQILEAIDEPNFQRLEQPECCPREYYNIMMKCWQHDPNLRPGFSDLLTMLPECKPEQVQAVQEFVEDPTKSRRDQLVYKIGDVITVLDKQQQTNCWKGVTNTGKTGWFNPANTVTYLGNNLPSNNVSFTRGDGKNLYSSKRKIRPDMISGPQGDFKHTGHVGLDGAYFGDLSFLGGKNPNLPRQVVTPYKPHEDTRSIGTDSNHIELSRNCSDVSDCIPLLKTQPPESVWAEANKASTDHEYHEISDDEELGGSPIFKSNGPSLMDEMESVLRSLGSSPIPPLPTERKKPPPFSLPLGSSVSTPPASPLAEAINVKNELKEMAAKAARRRKQATVKPISAADEKTLDSAIAMANELTAKSMSDLDGCTPPESPHTPASPAKRKFSFRFPSVQKHSSPKPERKPFAEQTACIPDIQALCDKLRLKTLSPTPTPSPSPRPYLVSMRGSFSTLSRDSSPQGSPNHRSSLGSFRSVFDAEIPRNFLESNRNGLRRNYYEKPSNLKLPPWDQASAEFYFARSRDLLTKVMPQIPKMKGECSSNDVENCEQSKNSLHYDSQNDVNKFGSRKESENFSSKVAKLRNQTIDNSNHTTHKTNANPSVTLKKEVPFNNDSSPHPCGNVPLRKFGSKSHLRRRSYNDRYFSSSSSDSSDSFNMSESEKQMNHRLKMRKQRRGGSFSSRTSQLKSPQYSLNSPPPNNSFLNSITSPKNACNKNKFYFANLKSLKHEQIQHQSLNNLSKPSSLLLPGLDWKVPERGRDSSSLTFTSSNSSSLNWEEYLELDRDFLSCSNCPPSPAPQSTISPEAKEVYSSLVEQPALESQIILPATVGRSSHHPTWRPAGPGFASSAQPESPESNPLRMLRSGALPIIRPKVKISKAEKPVKVPPTGSNSVEDESSQMNEEEKWKKDSPSSRGSGRKDSTTSSNSQGTEDDNPIPLPPRDRSKPSVSNKPRHQRKHPLVIPVQVTEATEKHVNKPSPVVTGIPAAAASALPPPYPSHHPSSIKHNEVDDSFDQQIATELDALDDINTDMEHNDEPTTPQDHAQSLNGKLPQRAQEHFFNRRLRRRDEESESEAIKSKPNLHLKKKIAQLNQIASLYKEEDNEDVFFTSSRSSRESNGSEEKLEYSEGDAMRRHEDHVSCEDLLEFSTKSQSKSRGQDSDEVRLMSKVLGKEMTTENCLQALNATDWDVYSAIKIARLQNLLKKSGSFHNVSSCWDALTACDGDVAKAASVLITQGSPPDCV